MTDEVKIPTKDELLAVIGEEEENKEPASEAPVFSEREQQAAGFGWMPKDKWVEQGGDPEDWRPAKDFLERGEMIGKIRSLTKETQENQRAIKHMISQQQQVYKNGYQAAIAQLKQERKQALEDGDVLKADNIGDKIQATQAELAKVDEKLAVPKTQQPDPEHTAWVQQNQWYNDPVMMRFADALAVEFVRVNNGNVQPEDVRTYVAQTVKKEFAHRFQAAQVRSAPNPDSSGSASNRGSSARSGDTSNLSKIEAEMPEEHRQIMKNILKSDPKFTKAEYLKMYNGAK